MSRYRLALRTNRMDMTAEMTLPAARQAGTDTFFKLALAPGIVVVGLEIGYLFYSPFPYDPIGYLIGRDFVNTWAAHGSRSPAIPPPISR